MLHSSITMYDQHARRWLSLHYVYREHDNPVTNN
jgi:hypothetical protein